MNSRIFFSVAMSALLLNSSTIVARCCSHGIRNDSGKFINEIRFESRGDANRTFRTDYNRKPGEKWNFTTNQIEEEGVFGVRGVHKIPVNRIVVIHGKKGEPNYKEGTTEKDWGFGNKNWIINPDLSVSEEK